MNILTHFKSLTRKIVVVPLIIVVLLTAVGQVFTVSAAVPTDVIFADVNGTDNYKLDIGFNADITDNATVLTASNYTISKDGSPHIASTVEQINPENVRVTFNTLNGVGVACGYPNGDDLAIQNVLAFQVTRPINCAPNNEGGFFGPDVVINEIVTAPRRDWSSNNYNGTVGGGSVDSNDEFIELRVNESNKNLTNWQVIVTRTNFMTGPLLVCSLAAGPSCAVNPGGEDKFGVVIYSSTAGGSITDTRNGDKIILAQPTGGKNLQDNDNFQLVDNTSLMMDSVSLGTFDDGYASDNALPGTSTGNADEALGRDSSGTSLGSAADDFFKQTATPGLDNTYVSSLRVMGVYPLGLNRIGIDFNKALNSSLAVPSNFTVQLGQNPVVISNVVVYGLYAELLLASDMTPNSMYTVIVSGTVTGGEPLTREVVVYGASDSTPPVCTEVRVLSPMELELLCSDENGVNTTNATATFSPSRTVSNLTAQWDRVRIVLDSSTTLISGTPYTLTLSGLKDNAPGGTVNTASDIQKTVTYNPTMGVTNEPLNVIQTSPQMDAWEVPTNLATFSVQFNKDINPSTLTLAGDTATLQLYQFDWATYAKTGVNVALSAVNYNSNTRTALVTVGASLGANTSYEVLVQGGASGVKDIFNGTMSSFKFGFKTGAVNDIMKPSVTSTSVESYDDPSTSSVIDPINVPLTNNVLSVNFSEKMDASVINASNLSGNIKLCTNKAGVEYCLAGQVSYDNAGLLANLTLNEPLQPYTSYTLTVSTNVKDIAGNTLASKFTRSFTTGQSVTTAPQIQYVECRTTSCTVKFDRAMGSSAANLSSYVMTVNGQPYDLSSAVAEWKSFDNALEITGLTIASGAQIQFAATGVKDYMGNSMSGGSPMSGNMFNDNFFMDQSFNIERVYPDWGNFDVKTNTAVLVRFSNAMNESTLSGITLKPITGWSMAGSSTTGTAVTITPVYIAASQLVKLIPSAVLTANTEYEITIPTTVKDAAGKSLQFPEVRSFKVGTGTDSVAPQVSRVAPLNGATDVPVGAYEILVKFSEAMDPATLNVNTFSVEKGDGSKVSGTVKYYLDDNSAAFMPTSVLEASTAYTIKLTTGVKDISGNALASQYTSSFTTGAADATSPQVQSAWSDGWMLGVHFDEHISESSVALQNFTLSCGANPKIISDKDFDYDAGNHELVIEQVGIEAGQACTITVTKVTDLAGNLIASPTNTATFTTMDVTGKFESNRVMYSYPGPGDNSFPPNSAVLEVGFQNPINIDTVTNSSVKLYPVNANGTDGTQINFSALDASNDKRSVYGTLGSSLSAGQKYHLVVTTAITDENGNNLMAFDAWNPNATTAYDIYFTTNSNNDTTAPQVWGTSLDSYKNTNGQVINVPQFLPIRIQFSKKMNSSTITDSDISDASSTIQIRDSENNRLVGDVVYLPEEKAALVNLASAFTPGANYTLIVKTTVTDLLGNALAQEYSQAFSVTPMADTVKPFIAQAECEEFECRIFFSEPVKKSQAESLKNYVLESPSGVSVSLSNKKIQYESMGQMVVIKDLSLKSDAFFKITVSNIQDLANNDLATTEDDPLTDNSAQLKVGASGLDPNVQRSIDGTNNNFNEFEGYVWANYDFFEAKMDKSAFTAGSFGLVSDKFGASMTGGGFRAEPMNKSTSQSTMWFIDVPVDQVIAENSYLQLKFPEGTVVSTATKPNSCMTNPGNGCSPVNGDINGPGTGTLTFTIDNLNDASRTVLLKLTGGATQARDFLTLDLNAIKTPSTKKDFNTDGYTVELSVLDSARRKVAGPYTSSPFFITGGGTAKIEGTITATGVDNGQTFDLQLGSPWSGVLSNTVTFSGGTATYKFENLQPGDYDIFLPSIVSLDKSSVATDYRTPPPPHFNVSDGVTKTYNFSLNDLSGAQDVNGNTLQTLTVNVTGGTATKKGVVEANSWSGHYKKEFTFDGDGAASVTFRAQQGQYFVNVWDYMPAFTFGPPPTPSFIPPAPKSVNVNGSLDADESSADTLGFVVLTPNRYISVTVKDENNNGIPNVDIFCQEPESMFGGGNGGRTSTDGVAMIRLFEGDFKCEAFVPGMQPMPPQKVRVTSSHNSEGNAATVVFTLKTAGLYKISGTVTSGSETVAYSPVWCNRVDDSGNWTPDWSNTGTDGSGAWSVLVAAGTWRCQADIMGYGPTDATEKTVSTTDVTGVTLSPPNDVVLFTGTIQINGAAPTQGGGVYAQRENGEQKFTNSKLDDNGTFTLRVKESNTDTYTVGVFIPGVLDKVLETGVSAAANSDLGTVDLSSGVALSTVTINLKNASNAAFNSEKAFVEITGTSAKNFKEFSGSSTSLQVPNGSGYKVRVTTKESGPLAEQTDVTVSADVALNFALLSNPVTISGKVTDADSAANQQGAFVSVLNPITGFKAEVQTNSSGNYTIQTPPNATYNVSVRKTGYLPEPPISQVVTTSAVSNLNFAIDAEAQGISITGTVTLGSTTANNNATVSARCTNGASVMDAVDNLGAYEVKLHQSSTITCTLEAYADGYTTPTANKQTVTPSTSQSGKNITATSTGGTIKPTKSSTVNPEQSSKVSDTDAGVEFNIPSGAITSSLTSATISMKKTGNIPKQTGNASIAADGIEISITDANGKAELSQPLTIVYDYATDSITDVQAENMTMAYLNESTGEWVDLPTTLDTTANTFTFSTDHFTVFGPKTNNDSVAPAAPTGLTATATSGQVVLNWADNAEADIDNYNIYRSTSSGVAISDSNQINTSSVAVSNYTDTTVSNGLTYYYAVTAVDSSGNESVISSEVSAAPVATSTVNSSSNTSGGGSTGYPPVVSIHQVSNSGEPEAELEAEVDSSSEEAVVTSEDQDQQQPNAEVSGGQVSFDFTNTDYEGHWAETYIDNVISLGLAQGVALNTFAPERNITRAEYTKMIVKAAGYLVPNKATKKSYGDVDLAAWYAPYIEVAKAAGMVKGYEDGTFRPNDTINRAEALKLLMEGLLTDKRVALDPTQGLLVNFGLTENPFTDLDLDTWYAEYVLDAYARGLVSGYEDHAFGPANSMTRAEFSKILSLALVL